MLNPDKNAMGRALSNEIKLRQMKLLDQRLAKGIAGKPVPTVSAGYRGIMNDLSQVSGRGTPQASSSDRVIVVNQGGNDDSYLLHDPDAGNG